MDIGGIQRLLDLREAAAAIAGATTMLSAKGLKPSERVGVLCLRSRAYELAGNLPAAHSDLEMALRLAPRDARLWNELGVVSSSRNDPESAERAFRSAVGVDPAYFRAWNNLGNCLSARGDLHGAVGAFRAAIEHKPDYALAWSNLGTVLRNLGDMVAAESGQESRGRGN